MFNEKKVVAFGQNWAFFFPQNITLCNFLTTSQNVTKAPDYSNTQQIRQFFNDASMFFPRQESEYTTTDVATIESIHDAPQTSNIYDIVDFTHLPTI